MARGGARPGAGRPARKSANTSPPSARARARARDGSGNQRPWPADKVPELLRLELGELKPFNAAARGRIAFPSIAGSARSALHQFNAHAVRRGDVAQKAAVHPLFSSTGKLKPLLRNSAQNASRSPWYRKPKWSVPQALWLEKSAYSQMAWRQRGPRPAAGRGQGSSSRRDRQRSEEYGRQPAGKCNIGASTKHTRAHSRPTSGPEAALRLWQPFWLIATLTGPS